MSSQVSRAQVSNDEQAIRQLVDKWFTAAKNSDLATMLSLLADDVIFMVVDKEPFGKEAFAESNRQMRDLQVEAVSDIQEIEVSGDWAWMRSHLKVTFTTQNNEATERSGYVLTVLRKNPDGGWVIARDANLLTAHTRTE